MSAFLFEFPSQSPLTFFSQNMQTFKIYKKRFVEFINASTGSLHWHPLIRQHRLSYACLSTSPSPKACLSAFSPLPALTTDSLLLLVTPQQKQQQQEEEQQQQQKHQQHRQ